MAASLVWMATYLLVGAVLLWACYNTSACLHRARLHRDGIIVSLIGSVFRSEKKDRSHRPPAATPAKAEIRR